MCFTGRSKVLAMFDLNDGATKSHKGMSNFDYFIWCKLLLSTRTAIFAPYSPLILHDHGSRQHWTYC
jgi:hypothetical protein